jgi:hypothetical protein
MAGQALTTASVLQCPHGGTVQITSTNVRATTDAPALAQSTDTFTIVGCPFVIPVGPVTVPSPCVRVQWLLSDLRNVAPAGATLSTTSAGLCLAATQVPQGPVIISAAQPRVTTQ